MKINRWMSLLGSVAVVLGASAAQQETAGGLRYFTRAALASADMDGIAEYIDATLAKCPAAFAAATDLAATRAGRARDALVLRVELARSLEAYVRAYHTRKPEARDRELMAWQGAKEMDNFFAYFKAERLRDEARAKLPPPVTLDVRAFGAKGDGVTDDGPAIRRALAAAKAKSPAPVTVRIPAGTYLVQPDAEPPPERVTFPNWRDYGADGKPCKPPISRPWKDYGAGFHFTCHDYSNLVICGEEGTEIRFTDSTRHGDGAEERRDLVSGQPVHAGHHRVRGKGSRLVRVQARPGLSRSGRSPVPGRPFQQVHGARGDEPAVRAERHRAHGDG